MTLLGPSRNETLSMSLEGPGGSSYHARYIDLHLRELSRPLSEWQLIIAVIHIFGESDRLVNRANGNQVLAYQKTPSLPLGGFADLTTIETAGIEVERSPTNVCSLLRDFGGVTKC